MQRKLIYFVLFELWSESAWVGFNPTHNTLMEVGENKRVIYLFESVYR